MARRRKGRPIDGVLLLDKPTGYSSNQVLQKVRRLYNAQKAGHTGSLDPLASGMLPICFGEATKFSSFLLNADKAYRVTAQLGVTTTTADSEGDVLEQREVVVTSEQVEKVVASFLGESMQVPSMFSALKHNGQPLYKLARQGIEVERPARPIRIDELNIESYSHNALSMYVVCSKGTYIRNLVEDIGESLGCGAHVTSLRREWVGDFKIDNMIAIEQLQNLRDQDDFVRMDELLMPLEILLNDYPSYTVDYQSAEFFSHGQAIQVSKPPKTGDLVGVYDEHESLLGLGIINDDLLVQPKRLVVRSQ